MKDYPLAHYIRHYKISVKHITFKKIYNLFKVFISFIFNKKVIHTKPSFLKIESSRKCTVNCKYCEVKKEEKYFSKDTYEKIIDKLTPWLIGVSLYDIGEPLWCPDLIDFIKYAKDRNIGTSISTSLSIDKDEKFWDDLILSGLDYIIVAIDGVTEEVYKKYRRNGNYKLVMDNLYSILKSKKKYNSKVNIEWQIIEFDWNKNEIEKAREMAKELGMDFRIIKETSKQRKQSQNNAFFIRRRNCLLPYLVYIINVYGEVKSCFKYYNRHMKIGDINLDSFETIWNNNEIQKIRDKKQIKTRHTCCKCIE